MIRNVDLDAETVFVNRNKNEIKEAPEFDESLRQNDTYRNQLGNYYGPGGPGYRDFNA